MNGSDGVTILVAIISGAAALAGALGGALVGGWWNLAQRRYESKDAHIRQMVSTHGELLSLLPEFGRVDHRGFFERANAMRSDPSSAHVVDPQVTGKIDEMMDLREFWGDTCWAHTEWTERLKELKEAIRAAHGDAVNQQKRHLGLKCTTKRRWKK